MLSITLLIINTIIMLYVYFYGVTPHELFTLMTIETIILILIVGIDIVLDRR